MACLGAMVLGTGRTEESDLTKVDGDAMILDKCPAESEGRVVVNRIPEFDEDLIVLHDTPGDAATWKQANEGREKGVYCTNAIGLDIVTVESSNNPVEMVQDSSVEVGTTSKAEVKDEQKGMRKLLKRKRDSIDGNVNYDNKESLVAECQQELDELFEYHKEVSGLRLQLDDGTCHSNNLMIAYLLEESSLPFSKLVEEIYDNLKGEEGITLASVRGTVLFVGQRMVYGISSADADVLEDESESCLWCWETRDMKLLPATIRGIVNIRRMARKKIHERISALSATLSVLTNPEHKDDYGSDLMKASMKLGKALNKEGISSFVEKMTQRNNADMAEKEARLHEKELVKEIEKSKRSAEKEKKKMERELQKEKLQSEKELKRMQEEAEREEKRRGKEEAELKKQIKKQQEEAAREQRRREKEEAEQKKQLAIQKQASMMERFLKSKKSSDSSDDKISPMKDSSLETTSKNEGIINTTSMDCAFSQHCSLATVDLLRFHITGWRKLAYCNRSCHWGVRQSPKIELIKELKLQKPSLVGEALEGNATLETSYEVNNISESSYDRLDEVLESLENSMSCQNDLNTVSSSAWLQKKKLLQFDKSHRPAYYGTWCRKSGIVGPRHPFRKDPKLDYDIDSDKEWEEEDPGESLSDCDKDEEESLGAEIFKSEDDTESEGSFVVPDGYLSESEGIQIESSSEPTEAETKDLQCCKLEADNEEFRVLLQRQKILCNLTEKALRKSQPLVISNLNHEKVELLRVEDLSGAAKVEQICLQALFMQAFPGGSIIDILANPNKCEDQHVCESSKGSAMQASIATAISDLDLPEFVRLIQSCPYGINKVVEVLQQKFPTISKSQLRNKVREISDFVDNRWLVKKDVLETLGLSASQPSQDKGIKLTGITVYFSKRCLPPEGQSINISESSPQSCLKSKVHSFGTGGHCTKSDLQFNVL